MAKLSYTELKSAVASIVTKAKLSSDTFSVTRDNIVALVDKIGKILTLDTNYQNNKLSMFLGEDLSFGKTIEEWQADLIMPVAKDEDGATALAPHYQTFRPNFYSYTIGKKVIPQSIPNNNIERAVHFEAQFIEVTSMLIKRMQDSLAVYYYGVLREMLAKGIDIIASGRTGASTFAISTAYSVGDIVKSSGDFAIVVKAIPNTNTDNYAAKIADGSLIQYDNWCEIAQPVDDTTGEAFVVQLKKDVEVAGDLSEGYSMNGNSLGATEGLVLIVKQGVLPYLEAYVQAGAFHADKVALPAEVVVVKDFGSDANGVYAVLMDRRGMRLHNTYRATRENANGQGDFLNLFLHTEDTAYLSRNTFFKVYLPA